MKRTGVIGPTKSSTNLILRLIMNLCDGENFMMKAAYRRQLSISIIDKSILRLLREL